MTQPTGYVSSFFLRGAGASGEFLDSDVEGDAFDIGQGGGEGDDGAVGDRRHRPEG